MVFTDWHSCMDPNCKFETNSQTAADRHSRNTGHSMMGTPSAEVVKEDKEDR